MPEKPILFSGPMVRAILRDEKTQTRRVITPQPISVERCRELTGSAYGISSAEWRGTPSDYVITGPVGVVCRESGIAKSHIWKCPYGEVGTLLWVRETWRYWSDPPDSHPVEPPVVVTGKLTSCNPECAAKYRRRVEYKATPYANHPASGPWRPSIFMPKWATRIWLEVTDVRVERLQDISEEDAQEEGVGMPNPETDVIRGKRHPTCIDAFAELWDQINNTPKRNYPWDSNPWVWVVKFTRLEDKP